MALYVIDASVVIQFFINDTNTPEVRNLFRVHTQTDTLCAPEFCIMECTNVLWKEARFRGMPHSVAEQNVTDLLALPLRIVPAMSVLIEALKTGLQHQLAIYDSAYIALAQQMQCSLISVDRKQVQAATLNGVATKPISDFKP